MRQKLISTEASICEEARINLKQIITVVTLQERIART
jgi:hypothetical protein